MKLYPFVRKKKITFIFLAVLLILAAIGLAVWVASGFPTAKPVNMTVRATILSADGTASAPFPLTVEWPDGYPKNETDTFSFQISKTEDFPYEIKWGDNHVNIRPDLNYTVTSGLALDFDDNRFTSAYLAADFEKGWFILILQEENRYLVATADPNVTTEQILNYFRVFFDVYMDQ